MQANSAKIEISPLRTAEDAAAFRTLNEEWITRHFALEPKDVETLADPQRAILDKGGYIFMVHADGVPVGCVALIAMGGGVFELSKMAVAPDQRGLGIGRKLLGHAIAEAKAIGAKTLFLGSSTKLQDAVHLYESAGFRHVPQERLPAMKYARADVFMEMQM
jgi:putative acetyltransferase